MDFDDIADDWEIEAHEEEERERQEEALKAAKSEKKLKARATGKVEEVEDEVVASDVQAELDQMRQIAQDIAGAGDTLTGEAVELIANSPAANIEDCEKIGKLIGEHLLTFKDSCNFEVMMTAFFTELGKEYKKVDEIAKASSMVTVAQQNVKKNKKPAKKSEPARKQNASNTHTDPVDNDKNTLSFEDVEDRGGAEVEDNENPW